MFSSNVIFFFFFFFCRVDPIESNSIISIKYIFLHKGKRKCNYYEIFFSLLYHNHQLKRMGGEEKGVDFSSLIIFFKDLFIFYKNI